ncbi:MAG: hypothetical protein ACK55Z_16120, partial [bacterium]
MFNPGDTPRLVKVSSVAHGRQTGARPLAAAHTSATPSQLSMATVASVNSAPPTSDTPVSSRIAPSRG